jgi:hypothetical protein
MLLLLILLVLGACDSGSPPAPDFPPLTYDYLGKLHLSVASIDVDNEFAAKGGGNPDVAALAPVQPADALIRMAQDRLVASGNGGHAVFVVEDASLARAPGGFAGTLAVRLDVSTSDGIKSGFAEARVARTYSNPDTSDTGTKAALYQLVKLMMADMNVEFEYQVKHKLRDYLQPDDGIAPAPPPVQTQDLNTGAPPPAPPTTATQPMSLAPPAQPAD